MLIPGSQCKLARVFRLLFRFEHGCTAIVSVTRKGYNTSIVLHMFQCLVRSVGVFKTKRLTNGILLQTLSSRFLWFFKRTYQRNHKYLTSSAGNFFPLKCHIFWRYLIVTLTDRMAMVSNTSFFPIVLTYDPWFWGTTFDFWENFSVLKKSVPSQYCRFLN